LRDSEELAGDETSDVEGMAVARDEGTRRSG